MKAEMTIEREEKEITVNVFGTVHTDLWMAEFSEVENAEDFEPVELTDEEKKDAEKALLAAANKLGSRYLANNLFV